MLLEKFFVKWRAKQLVSTKFFLNEDYSDTFGGMGKKHALL